MEKKLFRCGWCGQPTSKNGEPLALSQIRLIKDMAKWNAAKLVNGKCCEKNPVAVGHAAIQEEITEEMLKDEGV
ncbi:hypothetical protein [Endozoicomonas sp. ALC066]|uniref:hypothetical protein n=1 Tax=Endozoicomonas sp. ALC066 TaxID=3403078 RepID=UPI003BB4D29C